MSRNNSGNHWKTSPNTGSRHLGSVYQGGTRFQWKVLLSLMTVSVFIQKIAMAVALEDFRWLSSAIKNNTLTMNPWWRWRLFADKYNNHLLYSMIAMMSCVQAALVYKWYNGERIKRKYPSPPPLLSGPLFINLHEAPLPPLNSHNLSQSHNAPEISWKEN